MLTLSMHAIHVRLALMHALVQVSIANAGGILPLVELLKHGSQSAKLQAAGALTVLAASDAPDNGVSLFYLQDSLNFICRTLAKKLSLGVMEVSGFLNITPQSKC